VSAFKAKIPGKISNLTRTDLDEDTDVHEQRRRRQNRRQYPFVHSSFLSDLAPTTSGIIAATWGKINPRAARRLKHCESPMLAVPWRNAANAKENSFH
jgi:hypothetical protein